MPQLICRFIKARNHDNGEKNEKIVVKLVCLFPDGISTVYIVSRAFNFAGKLR